MAFPTTSILDALQTTGSLSGNWTQPIDYNTITITETSSGATISPSSGQSGSAYWNPNTFTGTEVYCTFNPISNQGGYAAIYACISTPGNTTANGYTLAYQGGTGTIFLNKLVNGSSTTLTTFTGNGTQGSNYSLGMSVIGGVITAYQNNGGSWSSAGTYSDSSYTSGYIGMGIQNVSGWNIINFGGGSVSSGSTYNVTVSIVVTT